MSSGTVPERGPATANDRSPTVTSRDRRMTSSEDVDDRRRHLDVMPATSGGYTCAHDQGPDPSLGWRREVDPQKPFHSSAGYRTKFGSSELNGVKQ